MRTFKYRMKILLQYTNLIKELVSRDLKLKYRRSFLGYVWSILNPLLIMIVLSVVFSTMFSRNIQNFPVYLIAGRTVFEYIKGSSTASMKSVVGNASLLKKTYVPKYIFTVAQVTSSLIDMIFSLGALFIVMVATGAKFHWEMFLLPFVFVQVYIFCCGLGLYLAQLNVFFRDMQQIYTAVTTAWTYLTPLFYPIERLPEVLQFLIRTFNPAYYYVTQTRCLVMYGQIPGPRLVIGGSIWAAVMLLLGLRAFRKSKDKFILYI